MVDAPSGTPDYLTDPRLLWRTTPVDSPGLCSLTTGITLLIFCRSSWLLSVLILQLESLGENARNLEYPVGHGEAQQAVVKRNNHKISTFCRTWRPDASDAFAVFSRESSELLWAQGEGRVISMTHKTSGRLFRTCGSLLFPDPTNYIFQNPQESAWQREHLKDSLSC